jgi:hypothetical protein
MKMKKNDGDHLNRTIEELTRTTEDLRELADDADSSRRRDAHFAYLAAVLQEFRDMKERKVAKKETKEMIKISGVKNGELLRHPIRRIIAATSDINAKGASKMTQALRFGFYEEWINIEMELKRNGGIAACARKFSKLKKPRKPKK